MSLMLSYKEYLLGHYVGLDEMLRGREERAARQQRLCPEEGALICFSLNIPGPIKVFPLCTELFRIGETAIRAELQKNAVEIVFSCTEKKPWGWEAFFAVRADPVSVKRWMIDIEDRTDGGRLFDIDVMDRAEKISRQGLGMAERGCLLCGRRGKACARNRSHPLEQIQREVVDSIRSALKGREMSAELLGELCGLALLHEVYTTPKPGLVDLNNNGSHEDMDVPIFEKSVAALIPYYSLFYTLGKEHCRVPFGELMEILRPAGLEAESAMRKATGGVNTHKGAVFSMGLLAAAFGYLNGNGCRTPRPEELLETAGAIAGGNAVYDGALTQGVIQYKRFGVRGARGEAAQGFPTMRRYALPALLRRTEEGMGLEEAGVCAFMELLTNLEDTNMIARGGLDKARQARRLVREREGRYSREWIEALDRKFIEDRLSPGGCADMLAAAYFVAILLDLEYLAG